MAQGNTISLNINKIPDSNELNQGNVFLLF